MKVKIGKYSKKTGDRKYKFKINSHDLYSAYATLAIVILPLLKKFQRDKHGSPLVANEDVPENLWRPENTGDWDTDENWHARWDYVVKAMIWSFKQIHPASLEGDDCSSAQVQLPYNSSIIKDWEDQFFSGEADYDFSECEELDEDGRRLHEIKHGPNHTLQFDAEGHAAYSARIDNGLRLFGKYYRSLWI